MPRIDLKALFPHVSSKTPSADKPEDKPPTPRSWGFTTSDVRPAGRVNNADEESDPLIFSARRRPSAGKPADNPQTPSGWGFTTSDVRPAGGANNADEESDPLIFPGSGKYRGNNPFRLPPSTLPTEQLPSGIELNDENVRKITNQILVIYSEVTEKSVKNWLNKSGKELGLGLTKDDREKIIARVLEIYDFDTSMDQTPSAHLDKV